jgi:hypothetical protein
MPFIGLDECVRNLEAKGWDSWKEVKGAFWAECTEILRESMEMVPVDTGRLRSTAPTVSHLDETPTTATAILGYGTDYGVYVHENLMARHHPPTRAKFLEIPVLQRAPLITRNIATRLGGGGYVPADTSEMMKI